MRVYRGGKLKAQSLRPLALGFMLKRSSQIQRINILPVNIRNRRIEIIGQPVWFDIVPDS